MLTRVGLVTVVAVALMPATAAADEVIEAQTVWRFDAMSYEIDQGEPLAFHNRDAASPGPHNVVASDEGPDGQPLFASKTIENGEDAPVERARQLKTGSYDFICTVHPFMQATLVVNDKGAPQPAPGSQPPPPSGGSPPPSGGPPPSSGASPPPSSSGGSPPPASGDTRAPAVSAAIARVPLVRALLRRRFAVSVTADEVSSLRVRLTARVGSRVVQVGTAAARIRRAGRPVRLAIRPSRATIRVLGRARRATFTLAVEARDAAGNVGTATTRAVLAR